jgi:hypothetical protein
MRLQSSDAAAARTDATRPMRVDKDIARRKHPAQDVGIHTLGGLQSCFDEEVPSVEVRLGALMLQRCVFDEL